MSVPITAPEWPTGDRLSLGFHAEGPNEAIEQAKAWARAEGIVVRTVCSVRSVPESHDTWRVVLAVRPRAEQ